MGCIRCHEGTVSTPVDAECPCQIKPIVKSVADIKRLPVGTELYLVHTLLGPQYPSKRVIKQIRSADIVVTIDDPRHHNHGRDSYLDLRHVKVEPTELGFLLRSKEDPTSRVIYTWLP